MSKITIYGGKPLSGTINIQGSKNASLPIICASLLNKGITKLKNIPKISDVYQLLDILSYLNVKYTWNDLLTIDPSKIIYKELTIPTIKTFRASYYLIGVFLSLFGNCKISLPGGCNLGRRPLDYHINAFKILGYEVLEENDILIINKKTENKNPKINLPKPSVGATLNIILASVYLNTTLTNYAKEPEVIDTINFLNKIGYNILVNDKLYTFNKKGMKNITYEIIPDRIETITYVIMALLCGNITINNINLLHIDLVIRTLILNNADIIIKKNSLVVNKSVVSCFNFKTGYYPEIPTDIQPLLSVLFLHNPGNARVVDEIFNSRFNALTELKKLGANVTITDSVAQINNSVFIGGEVQANDLRAAAALVLFALRNNSKTTINNIEIIERGYSNFFQNLKSLGAKFEIK